ncbi:MAG TPA: sulfur carrier protein ThiS [Anseongella sp.]|nr:sulfur carrier protein ThiS [Anseongella sp.]
MEVFINHEPCRLEKHSSLSAVLTALGLGQGQGLALAVNNRIIPRAQWAEFPLQNNDRIILVRAAQGG